MFSYYNAEKSNQKKLKITVVGESCSGKTSLVERLINDSFKLNTSSTIGAAYSCFEYKNFKFRLWDTAGQERYQSLIPMYLRNSDIVLVVFDLTDYYSYEKLNYWLEQIDSVILTNKILIGSKLDLTNVRAINYKQAKKFANEKGMNYIEISSKDNTNIGKLKNLLAEIGNTLKENPNFEEEENTVQLDIFEKGAVWENNTWSIWDEYNKLKTCGASCKFLN